DGTNGDTILERIEANFLRTALVARGAVIDTKGGKGRTVKLDVAMDRARLEDVLRLAVKAPKSPMSGAMKLTTSFLLPPGEEDVVDKLRLKGRFSIARAQFASYDVQGKVNELSHRGRGKNPDEEPGNVVSNFTGRFALGDAKLELPELTFDVPGTRVELNGRYGLRAETLDFR